MPHGSRNACIPSISAGCFLNNDLAEGRFEVEGHPISLFDIKVPTFAIGTTYDRVAPWRSVYKIDLLPENTVRFVLTDGGHNAGIVSEPRPPRTHLPGPQTSPG